MQIAMPFIFVVLFSVPAINRILLKPLRSQEPKQEKHFKVEELFPDGSQISRGANILHRPSDGNSTSYIFDAPYDKVWTAMRRVADKLATMGHRPIKDQDE